MTTRIAINGLGRIGRCVLRALIEEDAWPDIELVAANGPAPIETHLHLLKYDSVHGTCRNISAEGETLVAGRHRIALTHERDLSKLDWTKQGVDIVLECTGKFNNKTTATAHLQAGAKKVILSAPSKPSDDIDATIVYGVNNEVLKAEHDVISIGSCTTNCLAPVAKVLNDAIGIESGYMTTIHAYTGDQNIVDGSHKDLRRARAAALSMIPTSTGAAKALGLVLPELKGKLDGVAIRVPTPNVSLVDLSFYAEKDTSVEEINNVFKHTNNRVLSTSSEPLVSIDFTHNPYSSIVDLTGTAVVGNRFVRVASWYDNEWGFSCRMLDVARLMTSLA